MVTLLVLASCGGPASEASVPPPPEGQIYHAAFPDFGAREDEVSAQPIAEFERLAGQPLDWAMFSNNWWLPSPGIVFPATEIQTIANAGPIPYVRLMPRNPAMDRPDPNYTMQAFIDGDFDDALRQWARQARNYGDPLMVEFGTEVNGDWFPWNARWNGGDTSHEYGATDLFDGPERFRDAYRRLITLFRDEGANNITWVFHINALNAPNEPWNQMADYYPGDDYIDWIGVSVYGAQGPDSPWQSFEDILFPAWSEITSISTEGKPLAVIEWGVTERAPTEDPEVDKAHWIADALVSLRRDGPFAQVQAIGYWHENFGQSVLRLDSSPEAVEAYRRGLANLATTEGGP